MTRLALLKNHASMFALTTCLFATSALANETPTIKWRLASSFPKNLDILYGSAENFTKRVSDLTDGKFQIRVFAAGEIVPGLQVLDAVQNNTVEIGQTASYYYTGKNKAFAFDTAMPFGLTARQQNAWLYSGGGLKLMREFFKDYNIINFPAGNTGTQMGGWYRMEIKSLADLKGKKLRIPGMGGEIMAKLGAVPQSLAGADIYPALEKGTIDATEWVGPYDDEKLGFSKVAKFYYYPGFWEPSAMLSIYVNHNEWNKLPKSYQTAIEVAAAEANVTMQADYDAKSPEALAKILKQGVKVKRYPKDVMDAAQKAAFAMYEEEAAKNPKFKRIYVEWKKFRDQENSWFRLAESAMQEATIGR